MQSHKAAPSIGSTDSPMSQQKLLNQAQERRQRNALRESTGDNMIRLRTSGQAQDTLGSKVVSHFPNHFYDQNYLRTAQERLQWLQEWPLN